MKKRLTNNLGLKLLSLVFAVMLWLIVVTIDDPVISQDFSPIRVTMLNEDAVTGKDKVYKIEDNSDIISVRVEAKRSVMKNLSTSDFTATADMEKNIKFENLVGIEVTCNNRNVKSTDIVKSRENVVISVEDASSEQFKVVVDQSGTEGDGYMVGSAVPEQSLIQISGPASVITRIKHVEAKLDVTGFTTDRTERCKLTVIDNNDIALQEADIAYLEYNGKTDGMDVHVTMLRTKEVPLRVGYTGTPADGYSFQGISYKPETIVIAGTAVDIASVSSIVIPNEAVNIEGITESMQQPIEIAPYLPTGIRLRPEDDGVVAVSVEIEKKQGKTVKIPVSEIELLNVPRGMKADFGDLEEVEIIVMGTSAELAELNEDEITAALDLDEYSRTGTYTKKLDVTLPGTYTLMDEVEVEFELVKTSGTTINNNT